MSTFPYALEDNPCEMFLLCFVVMGTQCRVLHMLVKYLPAEKHHCPQDRHVL